MTPKDAVAFVKLHGIVLESGHGPVPNLAAAIAGERIRGSWWGHPKGRSIFAATRAVRDSPDVLVCKLLGGKQASVKAELVLSVCTGALLLAQGRASRRLGGDHAPRGHRVVAGGRPEDDG